MHVRKTCTRSHSQVLLVAKKKRPHATLFSATCLPQLIHSNLIRVAYKSYFVQNTPQIFLQYMLNVNRRATTQMKDTIVSSTITTTVCSIVKAMLQFSSTHRSHRVLHLGPWTPSCGQFLRGKTPDLRSNDYSKYQCIQSTLFTLWRRYVKNHPECM